MQSKGEDLRCRSTVCVLADGKIEYLASDLLLRSALYTKLGGGKKEMVVPMAVMMASLEIALEFGILCPDGLRYKRSR